MRFILSLLLIAMLIIGIIFTFLNSTLVEIDYLFGKIQLSLSVSLISVFIVGVFLGLFLSWFKILYFKFYNFRLKNKLSKSVKHNQSIDLK